MRDEWNTEELTDRAWEQMSALLDREMPVRPKRRRRAAWWWVLLLALLPLALFLLWPEPANKDKDEQSVNTPAPIARQFNDGELPTTTDHTADGGNAAVAIPQPRADEPQANAGRHRTLTTDSTSDTSEDYRSTSTPSEQQIRATAGEQTGPDMDLENEAQAAPAETESSEYTISSPVSSSDTAMEEKIVSQPKPGQARESLLPLSNLPMRSPEILTYPLKSPDLPLSRSPKPLAIDWHLGLSVGTNDGFDGIFTEGRKTIALGPKARTAIQAGLGLRRTQLSLYKSSRSDQQELSFDVPLGNAGGGNPDQDPAANELTDAQFDQLLAINKIRLRSLLVDLPLLFQYRIAPRWSVELGGRASYRINSKWENTDRLQNTLAQSESLSRINIITNSFRISAGGGNTAIVVNPWQWSATAGITYRLSPHWQWRIQYHHGLNGTFQDNRLDLYDRRLWISAGYRF